MAKQKFEAELFLNIQGFLKALEDGKLNFGKFTESFKKIAPAILSGLVVFRELGNVIKETTVGQDALNVAQTAYKTILTDVTRAQIFNFQGLQTMIALQAELNKVVRENKWEQVEVSKIQGKINVLRYDASDASKTETERVASLSEALKLNQERRLMLSRSVAEEINLVSKMLEQHPKNIKYQERLIELQKEGYELTGPDLEARRLNAQITQIQAEQTKEHADQLQRVADLAKSLPDAWEADRQAALRLAKEINNTTEAGYKLGTLGSEYSQSSYQRSQRMRKPLGFNVDTSTLKPMKFADVATDQIRQQNILWAEQEQIILSLADNFSKMFANAGEGFQNMADMMIAGLKRLVLELAMKAGVLALLSLLVPGSNLLTLANLFPGISGLGGLGKSAGSNASSLGINGMIGVPQAIAVSGTIKGKDIQISNRRNG